MSSSCRNPARYALGLALGGMVAAGALQPAGAAQTYVQPRVETSVEQHTNRNLSIDPDREEDVFGYAVTLEALMGYRTPQTDAQFRPRLRFQQYPDNKEIENRQGSFDMTARHQSTERTNWELVGRYDRRDAFRAELGDAEFDDLDPEDPTDGTGVSTGLAESTRTRAQLRPGLTHDFSERNGFRLDGMYETVRYSGATSSNRAEYDYYVVGGGFTRRLDERTRMDFGPYASRYETTDGFNKTDSYGLSLGWSRNWTERVWTGVRVYGDRSEIELQDAETTTETNFGGEIFGTRELQTGRLIFSAGRSFVPSSTGSRTITDELRLQYDWSFSQRLRARTAVRVFQQDAQGENLTNEDRDYARGELRLTWLITRTWYTALGYNYTWQDRGPDPTSADNHQVYLSLGYRALGPQRR